MANTKVKYIVSLERTITEYAEVVVEAASEEEAKELAHDRICFGDVEFEVDCFDFDVSITHVDFVEGPADWFLDQYVAFTFRPIRILFLDHIYVGSIFRPGRMLLDGLYLDNK